MRIGIFFTASKNHGGVYQYSLAVLESFEKIKGNQYIIFTTSQDVPRKYYQLPNFKIIEPNSPGRNILEKVRDGVSLVIGSILPKLIPFLFKHNLFWLISIPDKISQRGYINLISSQNLDFMIYPTSSNLSFLAKTPSAVAIHDLAHRFYPQFPEVSAGGRWELREYSFTEMTKKAKFILVDSKIGKQDVITCYPWINSDHIIVLPFLPPSYLDRKTTNKQSQKLINKFKLSKNYFYYPAKFWPHKHHVT